MSSCPSSCPPSAAASSSTSAREMAHRLREDPVGAMLSLGVDNPMLLRHAKAIVGAPMKRDARAALDTIAKCAAKDRPKSREAEGDVVEDDDEEAPPP